jgi:hypothetical protein
VLTLLAGALRQSLLVRAEAVFALGSAARFVRHLLRLPAIFFDQRQAADLTNRVRSNDVVADVLARRLASTVVDGVLVVAYGVLLVRYNVLLGLLAMLFAGLNVVALRYVAAIRKSAVAGLQADRGKLYTTVYTTIQMIESIKAGGGEQTGFQRFASRAAAVASGQQRLGLSTAVIGVVPALLAALNTAVLLWVGGREVLAGTISIGLLIGLQLIITLMNQPVTSLTVLGSRLQETSADLSRLRDVENYPVPPVPVSGAAPIASLEGHLRIEGLTFGYNPLGKPIIDGLDLDLPPGSRVALVGGSGSGKSTIGRLVAGLYEPWSGRLRRSGPAAVRGDRPRQRHVLGPDDRRRRGHRRAQRRLRLPGHRPPPRRPVQPRRRGRAELLLRTAAAPGDRPCPGQAARAAHTGRGDQRPGRGDRGCRRRQPASARGDVPDHRAPAVHDPRLRPDHGAGRGRRAGTRHARPDGHQRRPVRTPDPGRMTHGR